MTRHRINPHECCVRLCTCEHPSIPPWNNSVNQLCCSPLHEPHKVPVMKQAIVEPTWTCVLCSFTTDVDVSSRSSHESTAKPQEALRRAHRSQSWECSGCNITLNGRNKINAHMRSLDHLKSVVSLVFTERRGMFSKQSDKTIIQIYEHSGPKGLPTGPAQIRSITCTLRAQGYVL